MLKNSHIPFALTISPFAKLQEEEVTIDYTLTYWHCGLKCIIQYIFGLFILKREEK